MRVKWYPKNMLLAVVLLIAFAVALNIAIDFRTGAAISLVALLVYLFLDVVLTANPVRWWNERHHGNEQ